MGVVQGRVGIVDDEVDDFYNTPCHSMLVAMGVVQGRDGIVDDEVDEFS